MWRVCHVITTCPGMAVQRNRLFSEFEELCTKTKTDIVFADILEREEELCQFILDPTSFLPNCVSLNDPVFQTVTLFLSHYWQNQDWFIKRTRENMKMTDFWMNLSRLKDQYWEGRKAKQCLQNRFSKPLSFSANEGYHHHPHYVLRNLRPSQEHFFTLGRP